MKSGTDHRVLDRMPCCLLLCTLDGVVTYGNAAAERLFGVSPGELEGRSLWDHFATPEVARAARCYFEVLWAMNVEPRECSGLMRDRRGDRTRITLTPTVLHSEESESRTILCALHRGGSDESTVDLEADFVIGLSAEGQLFVIRQQEEEEQHGSPEAEDFDGWLERTLVDDDRDELRRHLNGMLGGDSAVWERVVRASVVMQGATQPVWWRAIRLYREGKSVGAVIVGYVRPVTGFVGASVLPFGKPEVPAGELNAEHELRRYLRVLETIFHTIPDAAWLKDREGRFVVVNRAYADLYDLEPRDIIGKTCYDLLPEEEASEINESDQNVIRARSTVEVLQRRRTPSGADREFETIKVPVVDETEEAIAIVGLSREVTERRRYIRELERYRDHLHRQAMEFREKLMREAARLEALCDAIPDLVMVIDAQGLIVRTHQSMRPREWLVPPSSEGKCLCDVLPPSVVEVFRSGASEAKRTRHVVTKTWSFRRGTETEFFRTRFRSYMDDQVIAVVEDVSESIARQEAIRQEAERLARVQRVSLAGGLATGIAHELNQPLASLALYASTGKEIVAGEDALDREVLINLFEKIDLLAARCGEIIRNLRRFIQQRALDFSSVPAAALVRNALMLAESSLLREAVRVETSIPDHLRLFVDEVQIQQVLLNLVSNAIDALAERPPEQRSLHISAKQRGRYIEFSVRDSGNGMPPRGAEKVFDPFFTTKPQGIGMGLAICKNIVESHGGRIWVESQIGVGTTVEWHAF